MIIERIDAFHQGFAASSKKELAYLGVKFDDLESQRFNALQRGSWSHLPFAHGGLRLWGVRVIPEIRPELWPCVSIEGRGASFVFSSSLESFLAMVKCENFQSESLFSALRKSWGGVSEIMHSAYKAIGGTAYHDFLTEFLFDDSNAPVSKEAKESVLIRFWNAIGNDPGFESYLQLVTLSHESNTWVPAETTPKDLGRWGSRYWNGAGTLAAYRDSHVDLGRKENLCWQSYLQPHGYDPVEIVPEVFPNPALDPGESVQSIVDSLRGITNFLGFSAKAEGNPLFASLVSLAGRKNSYLGVQHMEAAVLWDLEHNDPIKAWESLVSAAYWSGRNAPETMLPAWEAAIQLAEARGWSEAHAVLVNNWDFYHDFKRRNNIS